MNKPKQHVYVVHQWAVDSNSSHKILGVYNNKEYAIKHRLKLLLAMSFGDPNYTHIAVTKHTVRG